MLQANAMQLSDAREVRDRVKHNRGRRDADIYMGIDCRISTISTMSTIQFPRRHAMKKAPFCRIPVVPVGRGGDLPAEPLKRSILRPRFAPKLGRLVRWLSSYGRPLVGVMVECDRCRASHRYPWRWDWGLDPESVSFKKSRCFSPGPRPPVWLALDPALAAENAAVHEAAHEAFVAWDDARKAARQAKGVPPP
jgi:hypothetical protein